MLLHRATTASQSEANYSLGGYQLHCSGFISLHFLMKYFGSDADVRLCKIVCGINIVI